MTLEEWVAKYFPEGTQITRRIEEEYQFVMQTDVRPTVINRNHLPRSHVVASECPAIGSEAWKREVALRSPPKP